MSLPSTETLWAYVRGELAPEERERVKAHIEASAEARAALADVQASVSLIGLLPKAPPMPAAMARRVGEALAEKADAEGSRSFRGWWRALWSPKFVVAVAAACAVAFGVFQLVNQRAHEATPVAHQTPPSISPLSPVQVPSKPVKATVASARGATSRSAVLKKSQVLESGASVLTEKGGSLWLRLPDGTKAGLTGATEVHLAKLEEQTVTLEVARGSLALVVPHRVERLLTVRAGDLEVRDLGTRFLVSREAAKTVVAVEEGSVEVKTPKASQVVSAGHAVAWHDGELDAYTWRTAAPTTPPSPPSSPEQPVGADSPSQPPTSEAPATAPPVIADESDVEPMTNPEDEWASLPAGSSETPGAPPPPPLNAPPDSVLTVQPRSSERGFNLRDIEAHLRELERQAHAPFAPVGSTIRETQARAIARLADQGSCELVIDEAERWLSAPAGDVQEERASRRMVLQQKVRCLNRLGRVNEAAETGRQIPR